MTNMKNPITLLIEAYLTGRRWQMERLDEHNRKLDEQNKQLKRIADALEELIKK